MKSIINDCRYKIIIGNSVGLTPEMYHEKNKELAEIRLNEALKIVNKAREIALHLHIYHKICFKGALSSRVIKELDKTDLKYKSILTMGSYGNYVFNKSMITPNAKELFERKTAEENGGPFNFTKDQLLCTECGVQPCKMKIKAERHKGIPWLPRCSSCERKKKLATPYHMSGKANESENNRRNRQRERKKVA